MNLTTTPLIPVRMIDGTPTKLSLLDLFDQSSNIADLSLSTHEHIAVMRLLVCITQAAIGFPEDPDEWDIYGDDLEEAAQNYLQQWSESFELLGEGKRFLQTKLPASEKSYTYDQIMFSTASGNTPTLLDQRKEATPAMEDIALALLCYQNFFIGGSMASKVKGNGPTLKSLHTFLKGHNLKETILLNCIDEDTCIQNFELGRPLWELPNDQENATKTYLGRLVPTPCQIWLSDDGLSTKISQGFIYPEFPECQPETTSATRLVSFGKKEEEKLLRANLNKGIWRDLHCLLVKKLEGNGKGVPPAVLTSHSEQHHDESISIWSGELYKAIDAKIIDSVEASFTLPSELFEPRSAELYEEGAFHADFRAKLLSDAVRAYGKTLMVEKPDPSAALRSYWHTVSLNSSKLIETATNHQLLDKDKFGLSSDPWSQLVKQAAKQAYDEHCPTGDPRKYQAYTKGLNKLYPTKKKSTAKK